MQNTPLENRLELTRTIMSILDGWGLNARQLASLLALPKGTPTRALRRYRDDTPFPETVELNERLEHLCGIIDALRTTYPHNPAMGVLWMRQRNQRFDQQAPAEWVVERGLKGLVTMRAHLDCSFDWFNDGKQNKA
ncbi:MAG: DUF2384 domain-containing protein [Gammaproteobacteria bacterium]